MADVEKIGARSIAAKMSIPTLYPVEIEPLSLVESGQYFLTTASGHALLKRLSYFFRFSGPSISMDTACSSSFAAMQTACTYLWRGECDTAIAGGTNVLTNPDNFAGLDRGHFLSTTGMPPTHGRSFCSHFSGSMADT